MKIKISKNTEILVLTGPESSGKTTCAQRLANKYQLPLVAEYARTYLNNHGSEYTLKDVHNIASQQVNNEVSMNNNYPLIICDTDIITIEIWALEVYGKSLEMKDDLMLKKHYLLCYPDIPWEPDPLRENPEDRMRLFVRYEALLVKIGASFSVLEGEDRNDLQLIF